MNSTLSTSVDESNDDTSDCSHLHGCSSFDDYESYSELSGSSDSSVYEPSTSSKQHVSKKKQQKSGKTKQRKPKPVDVFLSGESEVEFVDEEDNVLNDFEKINKNVNKPVTRFYPDLIELSNEAEDPIDLEWQKRPTRVPQKLPAEKRCGSKFINYTPKTHPVQMFLEMWRKAGEIALAGTVMFSALFLLLYNGSYEKNL